MGVYVLAAGTAVCAVAVDDNLSRAGGASADSHSGAADSRRTDLEVPIDVSLPYVTPGKHISAGLRVLCLRVHTIDCCGAGLSRW